MKLGELHHAEGAVRKKKRRGKGRGTGIGGTAGRGIKGQGARAGGGVPRWFEGGQMPLQRRVPKRGFRRPQKVYFQVVDVGQVAGLGKPEVDRALLVAQGLVRPNGGPIKLLGDGTVDGAVKVRVDAASKSAKAKIEAAGGSVEMPEARTQQAQS